MRLCDRKGCGLTALWQVGMRFTPRWPTPLPPIDAWTGMCVCGLHSDEVKLQDFGSAAQDMVATLSHNYAGGVPDSFRAEIRLDDISDGKWFDPRQPGARVAL